MNSGAAYVYINSIFNTGLVSRPFLIHDLSVVCNKSNTTYATCEAGTTYSFGTHVFTLTLVQCPVLSSFMTYQLFVTRVTRRMPHQEQQLLTLSEHMCSRSVLSVARSLGFCTVFCRSLFVPFSFGHCIVYPPSIYGF